MFRIYLILLFFISTTTLGMNMPKNRKCAKCLQKFSYDSDQNEFGSFFKNRKLCDKSYGEYQRKKICLKCYHRKKEEQKLNCEKCKEEFIPAIMKNYIINGSRLYFFQKKWISFERFMTSILNNDNYLCPSCYFNVSSNIFPNEVGVGKINCSECHVYYNEDDLKEILKAFKPLEFSGRKEVSINIKKHLKKYREDTLKKWYSRLCPSCYMKKNHCKRCNHIKYNRGRGDMCSCTRKVEMEALRKKDEKKKREQRAAKLLKQEEEEKKHRKNQSIPQKISNVTFYHQESRWDEQYRSHQEKEYRSASRSQENYNECKRLERECRIYNNY